MRQRERGGKKTPEIFQQKDKKKTEAGGPQEERGDASLLEKNGTQAPHVQEKWPEWVERGGGNKDGDWGGGRGAEGGGGSHGALNGFIERLEQSKTVQGETLDSGTKKKKNTR